MDPAPAIALQTPTPGVGPGELEEVVPMLRRLGWFLAGVVVTVLVGWSLVEPAVTRVVGRRNRGNRTIREAISRYLRLAVALVGVLVGAVLAGYGQWLSDSALIVAAMTLALGVAARTVIGSLVSGFVLVMDPEFNVGDYIEWEESGGVIETITLRVTRVRTPAGELVTVPNTALTGQAITRPYSRGRAHVEERVGVDPDADLDAAVDALEAAAAGTEGVLAEPPPRAYVDAFGDDVGLRLHYWVDDPRSRDLLAVRSAVARAAKRRLDEAAIELGPTSQHELHGHLEVDGTGTGTDETAGCGQHVPPDDQNAEKARATEETTMSRTSTTATSRVRSMRPRSGSRR